MALLAKSGKSAHRQIQRQRREEYFQRLGESRCRIVGQERTERGKHEGSLGRAAGVHSTQEIRDEKARTQIEQDLNKQTRREIAQPEDGESCCQKRRVSRQAGEGGHNLAGISDAVDPMLQPIHRDISIETRIVHDTGEAEHKKKSQRQRRQARREKEPSILPHQFQHAENISRLESSSVIFEVLSQPWSKKVHLKVTKTSALCLSHRELTVRRPRHTMNA